MFNLFLLLVMSLSFVVNLLCRKKRPSSLTSNRTSNIFKCEMVTSFSSPFANLDDLDARFESYLVRQISFEGEDIRTALRSLSFNGRDSESAMKKSLSSSGKIILEGSLSFNGRGLETKISLRTPPFGSENRIMVRSKKRLFPAKSPLSSSPTISEKNSPTTTMPSTESGNLTDKNNPKMPLPESGQHRDLAALKLQKTYKSFRTRRQLADCAVLAEQRWFVLTTKITSYLF